MEKKMKKVKNVQNLVVAIAMTVAGVVCLGAYVCIGPDFRLLVAAFIVLAWAVTDFYAAFHKAPIEERVSGAADERDVYLAMLASRRAMSIFNKTLSISSVVAFWVYARFDVSWLLPVAATLCGVELFLFLLLLFVNLYYEKRG